MKILHLNIYRKWFDEIALGFKRVEHREMKTYWHIRLKNQKYNEIWFKNGYGNKRPFMRVRCDGILNNTIGNRYDILLGPVLEIKNWKAPNKRIKLSA